MPRAAAIDTESAILRVVELDGTARKAKLVHYGIETLPPRPSDSDPVGEADTVAEAISAVLKDEGIAKTGLIMTVPVRESVMRKLHVPFKGRENVRKVLKAEMEGLVHSHSIDEMVADHHPIHEDEDGTFVFAAAVPKAPLKFRLDAAERAGLEVDVLGHEAMGLYEAVRWSGVLSQAADTSADPDEQVVLADDGEAEVAAPVTPAVPALAGDGPDFRVVVQLGADQTVLLLLKDGELHDVRGLRAGDEAVVEEMAAAYGLDPVTSRWACHEALATGEDIQVDGLAAPVPAEPQPEPQPESQPEGGEQGEAPVAVADTVTVAAALVQKATDRYLSNLRRELVRFLASVPELTSVNGLVVTGPALEWPGMGDLLQDVFGCDPVELDLLAKAQHSVPEEDQVRVRRAIPVAFGLAIARIAGRNVFQYRQEELAFTRGFDRIKFPLALVCMLGVFALVLYGMQQQKQLSAVHRQLGDAWYQAIESGSKRGQQGVGFTGHLSALLPMEGSGWFAQDRNFDKSLYREMLEDLQKKDVHMRLAHVKNELSGYLQDQQQAKSYFSDLQMESGLAVLVHLAEVLKGLEGSLNRYRVVEVDLNIPSGRQDRGGTLKFTVVLRGSDYLSYGLVLERALENDCVRRDSPFDSLDSERTRRVPFSDGEGGAWLTYEVNLKPGFEPFPKEGN